MMTMMMMTTNHPSRPQILVFDDRPRAIPTRQDVFVVAATSCRRGPPCRLSRRNTAPAAAGEGWAADDKGGKLR
jgi:hypothetical protein